MNKFLAALYIILVISETLATSFNIREPLTVEVAIAALQKLNCLDEMKYHISNNKDIAALFVCIPYVNPPLCKEVIEELKKSL